MNKKRYALFTSTLIAASLALSGCQLLTGYQQIDRAENADKWMGKLIPVAGEVNLACFGTYHCEVTHIDRTPIISPETHEPVDMSMLTTTPSADEVTSLLDTKSVKIVPLAPSSIKGLTNYYARVKPIKREVHVNFYPENNLGYVERFAIIHEFVDATYQIRAYQDKSNQEAGSLLDKASPKPLCVELVEDGTVVRHFCKQADAQQQGEFIEVAVTKS